MTIDDSMVEQLVAQVMDRLARELGADGRRGDIIAVFTGATVGVGEALAQVRSLIFDGFHVYTVFSDAAAALYGNLAAKEWAGLPNLDRMDSSDWLRCLRAADGVIVPLLSVNTLSKITLLLADNVASNVILHALFMGKPVVAALDGVDPSGAGRSSLRFNRGAPALQRALQSRLNDLAQYGCCVTSVEKLRSTILGMLACEKENVAASISRRKPNPGNALVVSSTVVTAAQVAHAHREGVSVLKIPIKALITPLAREMASRQGLQIKRTA